MLLIYHHPSILETLQQRFTVSHATYTTSSINERQYEIHKQFIDIQFLTDGREDIYIVHHSRFTSPLPFDETKDIGFFADKPTSDCCVHLTTGLFCIIFPEEAHMPCIQTDNTPQMVEKWVAKVPYAAYKKDPLFFTNLFA